VDEKAMHGALIEGVPLAPLKVVGRILECVLDAIGLVAELMGVITKRARIRGQYRERAVR
jgi:hypothetical protein